MSRFEIKYPKSRINKMKSEITCVEALTILSIVFIVLGSLVAILGAIFIPFMNVQTHDITVTKVESVFSGSSSKYLIFTDGEVYEDDDIFMRFKFDSSDTYNKLKNLGKFNVKTCGYRIPLLSRYKNIVQINKVYEKEIKDTEEVDAEKEKRRLEYEKLKSEFE